MNVFVGADHRGFTLKQQLLSLLQQAGYTVIDKGDSNPVPEDDYVDFAHSVASAVVAEGSDARGIVICGSGVGVSIVANKIPGVRCGLGWDVEQVKRSRLDDDINVLALAADFLSPEKAIELVQQFLTTPFSGAERHVRRLAKITEVEKHA